MNKAVKALLHIRGLRRPVVAILVLIVAMPLISLWATYQIGELSERVSTIDDARLNLSRAMRLALDEETAVRGYVATGEPLFMQPYYVAHPQIETLTVLLPMQFAHAGLIEVIPALNDIRRLHERWEAAVALPLLANPHRADATQIQETGKRLFDQMRNDVAGIHTDASAYAQNASRGMSRVLIVSGLLAMLWIAIVGAVTLIGERRSLEREKELVMSLVAEREAVERLSDWRSRLLAMLAHDFKSHLAVIIGAAHLLEDFPHRRADPDLLSSVRTAGYTLAEMADNAILLARAQERRLVLQRTAFDISEIVESVVQRYGSERAFNVYRDHPTAMVNGDRSYVTRVMDNIIGNAVKYSERPVDVYIGCEDEMVRVSVADGGVGISDEDLPHIFEEFWRSENALWTRKGSGVGLFIVRQIMEAHGGSIRVESELGKETTVTLRFKRALTAFAPPLPEMLKTAT